MQRRAGARTGTVQSNAPFWYSFEYGSAHFTVISTEHDIRKGSAQREVSAPAHNEFTTFSLKARQQEGCPGRCKFIHAGRADSAIWALCIVRMGPFVP